MTPPTLRRLAAVIATASLVAGLAGIAAPGSPALACGAYGFRESYTTTGDDGMPPITAVFFGTAIAVRSPAWKAHVTVRADRAVNGMARRSFLFNGEADCGGVTLLPGHRYLFAAAPDSLDLDGTMVFETDGPAWRWVETGGRLQPLLDGHASPTDPAALLTFLREHVSASRHMARARVDPVLGPGCEISGPLSDPTRGTWAQVLLDRPGEVRTLVVGGLDGTAWTALRTQGSLRISGPADGLVLAEHADADGTVVDVVDIRGGTVRRLDGVPPNAVGVTIDRSGCAALWLHSTDDGWELWARPLTGDAAAVRLAVVFYPIRPTLMVSLDGRRVVIDDPTDRAQGAIVDLVDGSVRRFSLPDGAQLLPDMGERKLEMLAGAGAGAGADASGFPLLRVDPWTGRTRVLAAEGSAPVRMAQGIDPPVVTWRDTAGDEQRLRWFGSWSPGTPAASLPGDAGDLVIDGDLQGVEVPGWVPVFPGGVALPGEAASVGPRLVVRPETRRVVELPPLLIAETAPTPQPQGASILSSVPGVVARLTRMRGAASRFPSDSWHPGRVVKAR